MWWAFFLNFVWGVVLISSLWIFRSRGAYGYAMANLIAYSVHMFTSMYVYSRVHPRLEP